jgi:polysaccharide biosynthesis/export protein
MTRPPTPARTRGRHGLRWAVAAAILCASPLAAQAFPGTVRDTLPPDPAVPPTLQLPQGVREHRADDALLLPPSAPLLDAPVSRTEYVLGPGDLLHVAMFGEVERIFTAPVGPEGSLVIPGIGIVPVLGMSLEAAEQRVRARAARYFRNVDVRVALAQVREFKVSVVGATGVRGLRTANAATRVSEVVDSNQRNIVLRRANGETRTVDVVRYMQTGDIRANPTLREGDVVLIPGDERVVRVFGRVHFPGDYGFREGESLADLLEIANGGVGFPPNAADSIRIVRFVGPQQRTERTISREDAAGPAGRAFPLHPFDGVYVPALSNFMEHHTAQVTGQVEQPGTYPIRPDTTTLRELVEMAGGFTEQASVAEATLRREPRARAPDELTATPPAQLSPSELRIVRARAASDSTQVVVDFRDLSVPGTAAYVQTLRPGDVVDVPSRASEVSVLGAVATPGLLAYHPGRTAAEYIAVGGGYTRRADWRNAVLLRARTGARLLIREAGEVQPGDVIVVPFREPMTRGETLQTVTAIVSTVTGLVFAALAIFR